MEDAKKVSYANGFRSWFPVTPDTNASYIRCFEGIHKSAAQFLLRFADVSCCTIPVNRVSAVY